MSRDQSQMEMRSWLVFKETTRQESLFGAKSTMGVSARKRLENSWAEAFRAEVMPELMAAESSFAELYGSTGRPNFSVARMLGMMFLQEMRDIADQEALDALSFDVRWQHALGMTSEDAYLSRRSLVAFRSRLVAQDDEMTLLRDVFDRLSTAACQRFGVSTSEQRLDSTHVVSNVRIAGVMGLFDQTVRHFLKSLGPDDHRRVPKAIRKWYETERAGEFGLGASARRDQAVQIAQMAVTLQRKFGKSEVAATEPYHLLGRLVERYCKVTKVRKPPTKGKKTGGPQFETVVEITAKAKGGGRLQTVYDPDVDWGYKGAGYSVHIAETCNNLDKPEFVTDYEVTPASQGDAGKAKDVVARLAQKDCKPKVLYADGGYPTPEQLVTLEKSDVVLHAPVHRARLPDDTFGRERFRFDDDGRIVRCPRGCKPIDHRMRNNNDSLAQLHAIFDGDKCRRCPMLPRCPVRPPNHRDKGTDPRDTKGDFRLAIGPALRARDARWVEQKTEQWRERYRIRAGIEATNSELKRAHGMRRLRVRRRPRVLLAVTAKIAACNIKRWIRAAIAVLLVLVLARRHPPDFCPLSS